MALADEYKLSDAVVAAAEGLGALPLTGLTPGGQEKGSTQRAKAGGDQNLIRTDHRARSLKSMHFLTSQNTPNAAASAAIAGPCLVPSESLPLIVSCTVSFFSSFAR
jgi:hypothetical protein